MTRVPLALLLLAPALGAPDELVFGPDEGETVSKRFETVFEVAFDEVQVSGENKGEEVERTVPMKSSIHREKRIVLGDRYERIVDRRPLAIRRSVEEAHALDDVEIQGQPPQHREGTSPLEGRDLRVRWNDEDERYDFALDEEEDDEDVDPRLLEDLRPDADFRFLLPGDDVDPGDSWSADGGHLLDLIVPGGDFFPFLPPREIRRPPANAPQVQLRAPFAGTTIPLGQLVRALPGQITVEYAGEAEEDGVRLALLDLEVEAEGDVDVTERLRPHVAHGIPESVEYEYAHTVELSLSGSGRLRWDVERGVLFDLEWKAEIQGSEDIRMSAEFENPKTGEDMAPKLGMQADWEGSFRMRAGRGE